MVAKLLLAGVVLMGASQAWAGSMCPRQAQQAAYAAMKQGETTAAQTQSVQLPDTTGETVTTAQTTE